MPAVNKSQAVCDLGCVLPILQCKHALARAASTESLQRGSSGNRLCRFVSFRLSSGFLYLECVLQSEGYRTPRFPFELESITVIFRNRFYAAVLRWTRRVGCVPALVCQPVHAVLTSVCGRHEVRTGGRRRRDSTAFYPGCNMAGRAAIGTLHGPGLAGAKGVRSGAPALRSHFSGARSVVRPLSTAKRVHVAAKVRLYPNERAEAEVLLEP
jgi:hypothetical protein